jgi:transcriptional regulator with XRE-family HTH domain
MAKPFRTLIDQMPPARRARIARRTEALLAELPLHELRQARELSQVELAASLGVNQATVSKLERRTDMYLSTLRRFIDAMGGELEILARFPEGSVVIRQFADLDAKSAPPGKRVPRPKPASRARKARPKQGR